MQLGISYTIMMKLLYNNVLVSNSHITVLDTKLWFSGVESSYCGSDLLQDQECKKLCLSFPACKMRIIVLVKLLYHLVVYPWQCRPSSHCRVINVFSLQENALKCSEHLTAFRVILRACWGSLAARFLSRALRSVCRKA